jgi:hypothetical protein
VEAVALETILSSRPVKSTLGQFRVTVAGKAFPTATILATGYKGAS